MLYNLRVTSEPTSESGEAVQIMRAVAAIFAIALLGALSGCSTDTAQPPPAPATSVQAGDQAAEKRAEELIRQIFGTHAGHNVHDVTNFVHDNSVRDGFIASAHAVIASADGACLYTFQVLNDPHAGWNMYKKVGGEIDKAAFDKASAAHEPFADALEYSCQPKQ